MPLALGPAGLGAVTATPFAQRFTKQRIDYRRLQTEWHAAPRYRQSFEAE